ncbi:MAG TPA: 2-oxo acid dehydrogenase subunit E2 [Hellea balneolensis]|uniref:Dihydrolipoamide acetyltransferase component of pyruvate dehydrogenase complex n=1 Tax=Hellea balneolensis TaxID=287478 RepID=A0A7C5LSH4_9PROT|nr:2-oxo acid dehydrogenase subunit E2 [Hellea balneolensis]
MSKHIFKMPDIGEGVTEAEITEWHIKAGDKVASDEPVCDAMTDKATVELTAPVSGIVISVGCEAGEIMAVGGDLIVFETDDEAVLEKESSIPTPIKMETPKKQPSKKAKPAPKPKTAPAPVASTMIGTKPLASPAVRRRAEEQNIDLALVPASGKAGQITHADLDAYAKGGGSSLQKLAGGTDIKVTGMRRIISERMSESKRRIPHFSYVEAIDMTELERTRVHLNNTRAAHQPKLTLMPFFMRAMVKAVKLWPQCNATFDDDAGVITQHNPVHIGMAAQTPGGLMVPVIRNAESQDIWQLSSEIARIGEAAKTGNIAPAELSGSTISLTSLGKLAGVMATPVINRPEVAILCPNKIVDTPVIENGQMVVRKMMNFSTSFDHRVVDGFHAAEMVAYIKGLLEHPATLFID